MVLVPPPGASRRAHWTSPLGVHRRARPDSVDFREYRFTDEDFLGPNYLAVRRSLGSLIKKLRGR